LSKEKKIISPLFKVVADRHQDIAKLGALKIISATNNFFSEDSFSEFCEGLILQFCASYELAPEDIICFRSGNMTKQSDTKIQICAAAGEYARYISQPVKTLNEKELATKVDEVLRKKHTIHHSTTTLLFAGDNNFELVMFVNKKIEHDSTILQDLQLLLNGIKAGTKQVALFLDLYTNAFKDVLTKLPNRKNFIHSLNSPDYSKTMDGLNVLLIDLRDFSDVNDSLGQDTGDILLRAVAERLKSSLEETITISRVGGDVFGLLGPASQLKPEIIALIFASPFRAGQYLLPVSVNMGICHLDSEYDNGANIFRRCNLALNLAKKSPEYNHFWYSFEIEEKTVWRIELIRRLTTAFERRELELWFQPQLCLTSLKICGVEALLRWRDINGQYIPPSKFIPAAENSGLIIDLGLWMFREALRSTRMLHDQGYQDLTIAVNVSIIQLRSHNFVQNIKSLLSEFAIDSSLIELEITESVLMDEPEIVIQSLHQLKDLGFKIAIDDFGTGFSSLNYLQKMPIDRVKVDRQFVQDFTKDKQAHIAETIINLAHKLELSTIAEGVEREDQAEFLKQIGCEQVQGYLYARPMPLNKLFVYLYNQEN
jgi:diguanylate cyclase (GGDEF)-like protein